jgi:alpha-tubulin suppressor-like RCC1 family protein
MSAVKIVRSLGLLSGTLILTACGGGGSSGTTPPPPAATYTVGGTVTGQTSALVLANAGVNTTVAAGAGTFTVLSAAANGASYAVTVATQPTGQTCAVANGAGTVASANVANIAVTCTTNPAATFTIGGTVSGLGTGLNVVLHNSSGASSNVTVSANGGYNFAALTTGTAYAVTVGTQPAGQTCTVANASGTVASAAVANINVTCANNAPLTFTVGGTVSGLVAGGPLVLQNNAGNNLTVTANGPFTFTTAVATGTAYAVTRLTDPVLPAGTPAGQTCTVSGGSGTMAAANVTTVAVTCVNKDTTVPTIAAKTPLANTLGTMLTTTVSATFSEAMDTSSITAATFTVKGGNLVQAGAMTAVSGSLAFTTVSGATKVTFTPAAPLAFDTDYSISATTGVKDGAGNALASAISWNFNTGKRITTGGSHACARFLDGRLKCWGANDFGQLGIDNNVYHGDGSGLMGDGTGAAGSGMKPVAIPNALGSGHSIVSVAAGDDHTCAIIETGRVFCWGRNAFGELGMGFTSLTVGDSPGDLESNALPVDLGVGRTALQISLGNEMSCARLDDGSVKCWGDGTHGALGQGNTSASNLALPVALGAGRAAVEISAGGTRACAILDNGSLKCWGDNRWGQLGAGLSGDLGDGPNEMGDNLLAVNLGTVTPLHLAVADGHICVLTTVGSVRCFGNNTYGQSGNNLGNGSPAGPNDCATALNCIGDSPTEMGDNLPQPIAASGAVEVTVGYRQTCIRNAAGQIKCWGTNVFGQIGLGINSGNLDFVGNDAGEIAVLAFAAMKQTPVELSGGGSYECVANADATVQCWGRNVSGQLGRDDTDDIGDGSGEMGSALVTVDLGT